MVDRSARSADGTAIAYESLGSGEGLLILGGAWRRGHDYLPLARRLAATHQVHLIDRRGRGRSGPQGLGYGIEREVEDLLAVQRQTGATAVFGHSFGGLVALEAARHAPELCAVAVYEPGVSIGGSLPLDWLPAYRNRLAAGDERGAFAEMVRGAGGAPPALERMPIWYVKLILRLAVRRPEWHEVQSLMQAAVAEHEQVAALAQEPVERYGSIAARVILLGGAKSREEFTTVPFAELARVIPNATVELLPGLRHTAPDRDAPAVVADRLRRHLEG
jgi:pimeloyl-ACP methyl ester carboxylesterase